LDRGDDPVQLPQPTLPRGGDRDDPPARVVRVRRPLHQPVGFQLGDRRDDVGAIELGGPPEAGLARGPLLLQRRQRAVVIPPCAGLGRRVAQQPVAGPTNELPAERIEMTTDTAPAFGPPLIGQTENALQAILARELEGTGLSPSGWVWLKRVEGAPAVAREEFGAEVEELVEAGFLEGDGAEVVPTAKARELQARLGARVGEITARLVGDLPEAELATAGRVLGTVLVRAKAELGYSI
jgi:hypothetical protein